MNFTEEHVWIRVEEDEVVVGVTEHALVEMGEVTFVDLPEVGTALVRDDAVVVIESDGETLEILAPLSGEILEVNAALENNPALVGDDPLSDGWLFSMALEDSDQLDDLLDAKEYRALVG
ncbi:glycine cleavage system protein GcvH [Salipiger sp. IMCC34102]|uniref:glycine cleavage system protein GcvH n=1 Tax=Salipiger sp. IMCC34102 TaxID=2510647 RepID=UPI00101DD022|nr:glycine cleavage system protein GcvH [Salipiger sp. IMCC34102]RYH04574.1 glycine cleavage system protein GcvH [Salipiger sp. IMCC34102]